jgi:membrane protease YdiL (CAAX protease family)
MEKRTLRILLLVWLIANFLPHAVAVTVSGSITGRLAPAWELAAECSIMLLNLILPVLADRYLLREKGSAIQNFGWHWGGWKTIGYGLAGFAAMAMMMLATRQWIGTPLSAFGQRFAGAVQLFTLLSLLLVFTAPAEETMFRGWLQRYFVKAYGTWTGIAFTALLSGLSHLPMDLEAGVSGSAPASAWISGMIQLYGGALLFGIARHFARSTWASWIIHEGFLLLIILLAVVSGGD